ncbi:MAG: thioredoxin family protein [Acidobacteriota bacterium]|nr:MAG: thioredoxin family protein [Acidobacteriota bacterium]
MRQKCAAALLAMALVPTLALAKAVPGKDAPAFEAKAASGGTQKLSDYKGKWLVLEWFNMDCPFVQKHYKSGNMEKIRKTYAEKGVMWLTVCSSAEGKQGYVAPSDAAKVAKKHKLAPSAFLLDASGTMGKAYGAKTTPHMFIINPEGKVVYAGAIDDNSSRDPAVIPESKNYVVAALDAALAGKPVKPASTRPYGCSVKYAD